MDVNLPELPPSAYDEVRHRVLGSIRRKRQIRNAVRAIAPMAACAALLVTMLPMLRQPAIPPAPPMLARAPDIPAPVVFHSAAVRHRMAHKRQAVPAEPLMVRLETDDPNVVILWTVN